ncbi:hypothetical protein BV22DRAFT_1118899 [Leucogyrophana mollusca]|uniref:Uncharacterized protein n=1 Tax=Leucogyrophana mollusca TaxID=85980 RepID=A0ACB8BPB5_9AGAM|nr:hypothetical protein BV22DRAFT_1118899 [Leucogyrophana mollusca]
MPREHSAPVGWRNVPLFNSTCWPLPSQISLGSIELPSATSSRSLKAVLLEPWYSRSILKDTGDHSSAACLVPSSRSGDFMEALPAAHQNGTGLEWGGTRWYSRREMPLISVYISPFGDLHAMDWSILKTVRGWIGMKAPAVVGSLVLEKLYSRSTPSLQARSYCPFSSESLKTPYEERKAVADLGSQYQPNSCPGLEPEIFGSIVGWGLYLDDSLLHDQNLGADASLNGGCAGYSWYFNRALGRNENERIGRRGKRIATANKVTKPDN